MQNTDAVMAKLDEWVARCGNGRYVDPGFIPQSGYGIPEETGIQQVREEIAGLVSLLSAHPSRRTALEIGLGYFGSTHFLWRLLFDQVITVEKSHDRIREFGRNTRRFHGQWVLDAPKSSFLIGMSNDPATVGKAYGAAAGGVDFLFIDGDHSYDSVLTDWLLYAPLVRSGGWVAFHDAVLNAPGQDGVPRFLERLEQGKISGGKQALKRIVHSESCGIAYYKIGGEN